MYYAGIGSRETPESVLKRMTNCAKWLDSKGFILRSGGAIGADKAFEQSTENKEIFLARDSLPVWTDVFTDYFHPAPDKLGDYPRKLMNRNSMQILGRDGNSPVLFVVCWTKDGEASGGTGQALRIAEYYKIPIFNFYFNDCAKRLVEFVKEQGVT